MRCGAKCFLAKFEIDGKMMTKSVITRTPAEARRTIRSKYGEDTDIIWVRKEKS